MKFNVDFKKKFYRYDLKIYRGVEEFLGEHFPIYRMLTDLFNMSAEGGGVFWVGGSKNQQKIAFLNGWMGDEWHQLFNQELIYIFCLLSMRITQYCITLSKTKIWHVKMKVRTCRIFYIGRIFYQSTYVGQKA